MGNFKIQKPGIYSYLLATKLQQEVTPKLKLVTDYLAEIRIFDEVMQHLHSLYANFYANFHYYLLDFKESKALQTEA